MTLEFVPFHWETKDELYIQAEIDGCIEDLQELLSTCQYIWVDTCLYTVDEFSGVGMGFRGPTLVHDGGLYSWFYRVRGGFKSKSKN